MAFLMGFGLLFMTAFLQLSECQNYGSDNGNPSGNTGFVSTGFGSNTGDNGFASNTGNTGFVSSGSSGNSGYGSNVNSGSWSGSSGSVVYPNNDNSGFVPANQRNCAVSSVQAQPMFDMYLFQGAWRVLKRSSAESIDPILNNFLEIFSNSAFFNTKTHSMKARMSYYQSGQEKIMEVSGSSTRSMSIFGIKFDFCQEIPAIFLSPRDPNQPGKFSMRFKTDELGLGFEMDISAVMHGLFGKNFFEFVVLSTDYKNYAIVWNCKRVLPDGTCGENVVLVMSRGKSLTDYQEQLVKTKLATICVDYKELEDEPHLTDECNS